MFCKCRLFEQSMVRAEKCLRTKRHLRQASACAFARRMKPRPTITSSTLVITTPCACRARRWVVIGLVIYAMSCDWFGHLCNDLWLAWSSVQWFVIGWSSVQWVVIGMVICANSWDWFGNLCIDLRLVWSSAQWVVIGLVICAMSCDWLGICAMSCGWFSHLCNELWLV